jgi:hypothetical protein
MVHQDSPFIARAGVSGGAWRARDALFLHCRKRLSSGFVNQSPLSSIKSESYACRVMADVPSVAVCLDVELDKEANDCAPATQLSSHGEKGLLQGERARKYGGHHALEPLRFGLCRY